MLFGQDFQPALGKMLRETQAQRTAERKEDTQLRLDLYRGRQVEHIQEQLAASGLSDPGKLQPLFINLVKKVVDALAMVYAQPAKREIDGTERDNDLMKVISESAALDVVMKQASKLCKLLKTVLLRVVWRNGQLEVDVLTGEVVDVWTEDDRRTIRKVVVTHFSETGRPEDTIYSVWTPDEFQRLDWRGNVLEAEPNPYGVIPFVSVHDSMPVDDFWVEGGGDLISAQDGVNRLLTDMLHTARQQGYGIGWVRSSNHGPGAAYDSVTVDPGALVNLPPDGALGFESTEMPIEKILEAIQFIISQCAIANGLSAHSLTVQPINESGVSKIVSNTEMMERRQDDLTLFRRYEHRLFEVVKAVWNAHNPGKKFSDKAQLKVDFADLKSPFQDEDEANRWGILIDMGQASPVDFAIARNADLSRKGAMEYLRQVHQERKALTALEEESLKESIGDLMM